MRQTIVLVETILTDGSRVYDVALGDTSFPCTSFEAAASFVETIQGAVRDFTNDTTRLVEIERGPF